MNNETSNSLTVEELFSGVTEAQEATKRAKEMVLSVTLHGTKRGKSFSPKNIAVALQGDAYSCAQFVGMLRKEEARGTVIITANLDDHTLKVERSDTDMSISGVEFGQVKARSAALSAKAQAPMLNGATA